MQPSQSPPRPSGRKRSRFEDFVPPANLPSKRAKILPIKTKSPPTSKTLPSPTLGITEVESSTETETSSPSEFEPPEPSSENVAERKDIVSTEITEALDRCQMSSQQAMMVLAPCLVNSGINIKKTIISRSTITNRSREHRALTSIDIRDNFDPGDTLLTVHFDGKKMRDHSEEAIGRNATVERLAIVVSSINGCKLLAIPKIENGLGQTIADSVRKTLVEWNLWNDVRALCFDTTSSNSGIHIGSSTILASMLPNPVLLCACRHHIAELLLSKAFKLTVEGAQPHQASQYFKDFKMRGHTSKLTLRKFMRIVRSTTIKFSSISQQQFELN